MDRKNMKNSDTLALTKEEGKLALDGLLLLQEMAEVLKVYAHLEHIEGTPFVYGRNTRDCSLADQALSKFDTYNSVPKEDITSMVARLIQVSKSEAKRLVDSGAVKIGVPSNGK